MAVTANDASSNDDSVSQLNILSTILTNSPHDFLQSTPTIHAASLVVAKQFLDPLAASIAATKSRRRNNGAVLDKIYLEGFDVQQVWEQVRMLVDEVEGSLGNTIPKALKADKVQAAQKQVAIGKKRKAVQFEPSDNESSEGGEDGGSEEGEGSDVSGEEDGEFEGFEGQENDDEAQFEDEDDEEEFAGLGEEKDDEKDDEEGGREVFVQDVHGLNDGFFSIDEFNRQTEVFEQLDQNGDDEEDSDEEIDYNADPNEIQVIPNSQPKKKSATKTKPVKAQLKKGKASKQLSDDEEDDFKDDFHDDYEEEDDEDMDMGENANDIMYADFFAPPPKKGLTKAEQKKQSWKDAYPKKSAEEQAQELANIQADMERVNRDLFEEDDESEQGSDDEDVDFGNPANRKSTFEKRQQALTEEIRKLELTNLAKKQWTLSGEARASQRPLNSLLEEDLDFERIGKPVPVITQEVTEGLEDMIKRRILAGEFDDLKKRRPGDVSANFRRGRVDLDDTKPQESLAEIYEREHLQSIDPANNPNKQDEKIAKEEAEISALFFDLTKKLDALSSWHFTPKPPKPSITIVSDAPTIAMEEALPTASAGGAAAAGASMLAPQEVYNPVKDKKDTLPISGGVKEIVGKSGAPISVAEMTSEEKKKRRKQKKDIQRKQNQSEGKTHGGKAKDGTKKDLVDTLKKGGVKVIGKGGEKRDLDGNVVKEKNKFSSSNSLKL